MNRWINNSLIFLICFLIVNWFIGADPNNYTGLSLGWVMYKLIATFALYLGLLHGWKRGLWGK